MILNRFRSRITMVTRPIAGTYIDAFSLTCGAKFYTGQRRIKSPARRTFWLEKLMQMAPSRRWPSGTL